MGLVARVFEREGIPTVTLSSALDISQRIRAPRTAFLNFPLGNQVGPPHEPALQRQILAAALQLFASVEQPGEIVRLPFEWADPGWREGVLASYRSEAAIVRRQRVEGEYAGGVNVAVDDCDAVCKLV